MIASCKVNSLRIDRAGPGPGLQSAEADFRTAQAGHPHFQFLNHRDGETVRSTGIEASRHNLRVSVVNILDAPHGGGA